MIVCLRRGRLIGCQRLQRGRLIVYHRPQLGWLIGWESPPWGGLEVCGQLGRRYACVVS